MKYSIYINVFFLFWALSNRIMLFKLAAYVTFQKFECGDRDPMNNSIKKKKKIVLTDKKRKYLSKLKILFSIKSNNSFV